MKEAIKTDKVVMTAALVTLAIAGFPIFLPIIFVASCVGIVICLFREIMETDEPFDPEED